MAAETIPIHVPQSLYHRLERLAELTQQPLESLVVQALSSSIPLLPDELPPATRHVLIALEHLSDDQLWEVARSEFGSAQAEQFATLREKRRAGTLTVAEQATIDRLAQEVDLLTLRKAYAAVLLKWRGYRLPTLAELEGQV